MTTVTGYKENENSATFIYFQINESWKSRTGKGVSVAIIDSGIDTNHPDLQGKVRESVEAKKENMRIVFEPSESGDSAGHGTACAGIISGIAPESELYSIKVLGAGGLGDGQAFLAGLEYAINNKYRIINLSLGTTKPQYFAPLHDLLDRAYQAGCIVVAAANNLPQPSFPSVFSSSLISVSKSDETDPLNFGFKYGEVIELTAPGVKHSHGVDGKRLPKFNRQQFRLPAHRRNHRSPARTASAADPVSSQIRSLCNSRRKYRK